MSANPATAPTSTTVLPTNTNGAAQEQSSPKKATTTAINNTPGNFTEKVLRRQTGIVTYGLTPPRVTTEDDKVKTLVENTIERLNSMPIDSAIIYDIHDESDRQGCGERPFPYVETHDGEKFMNTIMPQLPSNVSCIYYRCIQKNNMEQLTTFVQTHKSNPRSSAVFVGASSTQGAEGAATDAPPPPKLTEVYKMHQDLTLQKTNSSEQVNPADAVPATTEAPLVMGAVAIPERHASKGTEHERMIFKQKQGCKFFVTQVIFSAELCKNMLSDYMVACRKEGLPVCPVILTFAPIGSMKTFEFMKWLGVEPSRWLANDLNMALEDTKEEIAKAEKEGHTEKIPANPTLAINNAILEESVDAIVRILQHIAHWAKSKNFPIGVNIESVAIRKAEIDAAAKLVTTCKEIMDNAV